jgi:ergosteryl-3beta-O-L-aspartate synthase
MSFLKKPFRKLKEMSSNNPSNNDSIDSVASKHEGINESGTDTPPNGKTNGTSTPLSNGESKRQSREIIAAERARRSMDRERAKAETKKRETMARIENEKPLQEGPPMLTKLYRPYSMNQSKRWTHEDRLLFKNIDFESGLTLPEQLGFLLISPQKWRAR